MFEPTRHYSFGTDRHFTEIPRDEIADITVAMKSARMAFLQSGLWHLSLSTAESDLRAVLGRIDGFHSCTIFEVKDVVNAIPDAVRRGELIFVPRHDDLRRCVKAIQDDRGRRPAVRQQSQPDCFDTRAAAQPMYGKLPRAPQDFDAPSSSRGSTLPGDAHSFEYSAENVSSDSMELAGIPFDGAPNRWVENAPGKKIQWRMYGSDGTPAVDIDFDDHHGQPNPHAHNWDDQGRDHGWPVSILP